MHRRCNSVVTAT